MKPEIVLAPEALTELSEAAIWYEEQLAGLGEELLDSFWEELKYAVKYPELFPVINKKRNFRRLLLKRFPYIICFTMDKHQLIVAKFIHTSRHPRHRNIKGLK